MHSTLATALAAFIAYTSPSAAHDFTVGSIEINHPWSRPTPPSAPVAGGYMKLTNTGSKTDRLVRVTSPIAERAEIHRSLVENGVASMRPVVEAWRSKQAERSISRPRSCTSCSSHQTVS